MELSPQAWNTVLLIAGVLGALFSGAGFFGYQHYKTRLNESQGPRLNVARALISPTPWRAYINRLRNTLDHLDRWMGRLDEPGKLFNWCVAAAFIYPLIFLLAGWVLGAPAKLGNTEILPPAKDVEPVDRLILAFGLSVTGLSLFLYIKNIERIARKFENVVNQMLPGRLLERHRITAKNIGLLAIGLIMVGVMHILGLPRWLAVVLAVALIGSAAKAFAKTKISALSGAIAVAGLLILSAILVSVGLSANVGALAVALFIDFMFAGILAGAISGVLIGPVAYSGILALVSIGMLVSALAGLVPMSDPWIAIWVLFLTLLPFFNAIFDGASWWVSRCLGSNLVSVMDHPGTPTKKRVETFIKDISIDLVVALCLLIALAWSIPHSIDLWNRFLVWATNGKASLELATYLCAAAKAPLTDGLWATGMLFSTLIPTAAHLTLLLLAFVLWPFQPRTLDHQRAAHILENHRPPAKDLEGVGKETIEQTWPTPAPTTYAIPADIDQKGAYPGDLHPDTVNALSWKLGVRRPAYYLAAFAGLCTLLYLTIGTAFATWHPLPQILLMIAGFTKEDVDSSFAS